MIYCIIVKKNRALYILLRKLFKFLSIRSRKKSSSRLTNIINYFKYDTGPKLEYLDTPMFRSNNNNNKKIKDDYF